MAAWESQTVQQKLSYFSFKDQKAEARTGRLLRRSPSNRSPRCRCWARLSGGPYPCAVWRPSVTRRTEQPGRKEEGLGAAGTSERPSWLGNPVWDLPLELGRWYPPIFSPPHRSPPPPAKDSITLAGLQLWGPGQPRLPVPGKATGADQAEVRPAALGPSGIPYISRKIAKHLKNKCSIPYNPSLLS